MAQILINSRMCFEGHRPICQDTGIVTAFIKVGMNVRCANASAKQSLDVQQMVDDGVRRAYLDPDNMLRASILPIPPAPRQHQRQHARRRPRRARQGDKSTSPSLPRAAALKPKKFAMLNPSDSVVDWVLKTVPTMGAGWCPPGMLGIGIGGTAEKAMVIAKESLMDPIDMQELIAARPQDQSKNCASSSTKR